MPWRIYLLATVLAWTHVVRADALVDLPGDWADLSPVPELDISGAEARARSAIQKARGDVATLLDRPGIGRPELGEAYGQLGAYYHVYNIRTGAEACYSNAMRLAPDEFRWAYLDAYLAHVSGRYAEGLERFDRAREIDPAYAPIKIYEAEALLEFNRVDEAEERLRSGFDVEGLRARAAYRLGQIALQRREFDEAVEYLETALQLDPAGTAAYFPLAQALRGAGDAEAARAALARRGTELPRIDDPFVDELESLDRGARPFYLAGLAAARNEDFEAAAEAFRKGLEQDPDNLPARVSFARSLYVSGRRDEARVELERVQAASPDNADASFFLGLMDNAAGDESAARRRFAAVLRVRPDHSGALYFTGLMDFGDGDYASAARNLNAAVAAEPGNFYAQVLALVARHRQGAPASELVPALHAAIDADPGQWLPRYALVRLLAAGRDPSSRDVPRALEMAQDLAATPPHAAVYEALALAQAAAGNFAAAEKSLESAQSGYFFNGRFADVSRLDGQIAEVRQQRLPAEAWPAEDPLLRVPVISPLGPFKEYPAPRAY